MRASAIVLTAVVASACAQGESDSSGTPDFSSVSRIDSGTPVAVMLTAYSTTLLADGEDRTELRIAVTDRAGGRSPPPMIRFVYMWMATERSRRPMASACRC